MTFGESIDALLMFYVNVGSDTVTEDPALRSKARFIGTAICKRTWNRAPYSFRLETSNTVALTAGVGSWPSDFNYEGKQFGVYSSSQPRVPLVYARPQQLAAMVAQVSNQGAPFWYTLGDTTAAGVRQVLTYPQDSSTLTIRNYVKKCPTMVDHPGTQPVLAVGSATGLTGTFTGKVTFVTALGETEGGPVSAAVTVANQKINWTGIPIADGPHPMTRVVTARKLYRPASTGGDYKLVTTISDNVTTTFEDNVADIALGVVIPALSATVTGLEQFPEEFHEDVIYGGMVTHWSSALGDNREPKFSSDWEKNMLRMWNLLKDGQAQPRAFPAYRGGSGGGSSADYWRMRIPG